MGVMKRAATEPETHTEGARQGLRYDGENVEFNGSIYCGWFVVLLEWSREPLTLENYSLASADFVLAQLKLWGLTVRYLGNVYLC